LGKFSIAVDDSYGSGDQKKESVYFFDITTWGKTAEICGQYLKKGKQICVVGKLVQDRWKNKEGENRSKVGITARSVQFLASPKDNAKPDGKSTATSTDDPGPLPADMGSPAKEDDTSDIPF